MTTILLGIFLYLVDMIISLIISISIIDKLYITKKYNKKEHFHRYNDLFSWEIFFLLVSISNILQIISSFFTENLPISNLLFKISILIFYNNFWLKMIHVEKIMNVITYERHYFAGIIPIIIVIVIFILNFEVTFLLIIFLATSFLPFLLVTLFLRNTGITIRNTLEVSIGTIFFGLSLLLNPVFLKNLIPYLQIPISMMDLMFFVAPLSLLIGTLLIIEILRKQIF